MPTDSTELTFVRCPSCRSLVPAMSTRCRMCGATLESVGKEDLKSSDTQKQQGRVRQRTMSQPDDALESGIEEVRDAKGAPAAMPSAGTSKGKEIAIDDPLRDFLEEIPLDESQPVAKTEPSKSNGPSRDMDDSKVIIESGRGAKSEGLSFAKGKPEIKAEPKREERLEVQQKSQAQNPPTTSSQRPPQQPRSEPRDEPRQERKEASRPQAQPTPQSRQQPREQRDSRPPRREESRSSKTAPQTQQSGRLFGWLVSYDDPNGSAIEIREGKFFVSAERLKPNDLVVDHESVSTPHAVVVTDVEVGLQVQDLMSDHGVFVKRRGAAEHEKYEDRVSVSNGDWLRFGEVEFLVSLVAHVGVK